MVEDERVNMKVEKSDSESSLRSVSGKINKIVPDNVVVKMCKEELEDFHESNQATKTLMGGRAILNAQRYQLAFQVSDKSVDKLMGTNNVLRGKNKHYEDILNNANIVNQDRLNKLYNNNVTVLSSKTVNDLNEKISIYHESFKELMENK